MKFLIVVALLLLTPSLAHAQGDALVSVSGVGIELIVSLALVPLLLWGASKLGKYIDAKIDNQTLRSALLRVNSVVVGVVAELSQELADKYKEASSDGKLSDAEKEELKGLALAKLKTLISPSTWVSLSSSMGGPGVDYDPKVETLLSGEIERVIRSQPVKPKATIIVAKAEGDEGK